MAWSRRIRLISYAVGVTGALGMLLGARLLSPGAGGGGDPAPKSAADPAAKAGPGPVVPGYVDSDPSPVAYGPVQVLQFGQVTKVYVTEDSHVNAGDKLYEFDATNLEAERRVSEQQVKLAEAKVNSAQALANQHQTQIDAQQIAVESAQVKVKNTQDALTTIEANSRKLAKGTLGTDATEERINQEVQNDPNVLRTRVDLRSAELQVKVEQAKMDALKKADVQVQVAEAREAVGTARAALKGKEDLIRQCVVRAKQAGTIERVQIGAGDTIGVGTRTPAVILIPDGDPPGKRIVRALVEPEFAHRIKRELEGKEIVIFDDTDPTLTYKGAVRKIGSGFLPKRSAGDALIPSDSRVLEVRIEVTDPTPPGKPPLRVGQKVKVNLGQ